LAYIVGLTGGIGSGKSTVLAMLAARGAIVIDADAIVHELQEPGTEVFTKMVETFGADIVGRDGRLDRPKVASIVFSDEAKRKQLNEIVHPAVGTVVAEKMTNAGDSIVVIDVPLMAESPPRPERTYRDVIVVDASPEIQLERLIGRGMDEADAKARMAAQAGREDRLKIGDHVIDNNGDIQSLERQVDELWAKLEAAAKEEK
jgi:dephospho-CoA kinase